MTHVKIKSADQDRSLNFTYTPGSPTVYAEVEDHQRAVSTGVRVSMDDVRESLGFARVEDAEGKVEAVKRLIEHYETYAPQPAAIPAERLRDVIGYPKPKPVPKVGDEINDVALLEALPVGSVVLQLGIRDTRSWHRYEPRTVNGFEYAKWMCADGGRVSRQFNGSILLPVKVLHVGSGK